MTARTLTRPLPVGRRIAAALIAGVTVAVVTHAVVTLLFFLTNGSTPANIPAISDYFVATTLVLFVLAAVGVLLGLLKRPLLAAALGLVASILATFVGTSIGVLETGTPWSTDVFGYVLGSLLGTNLIYIVVATLVTATVAVRVWFAVASVPQRDRVLVRMPSPRLAEGEVTHIDRVPLVMAESVPDSVAIVESLGYRVVTVDVSEFEKLEGCVTCLSVRLRSRARRSIGACG